MPLPVRGAQLPITAYLETSGKSSKRAKKTGSFKASPKRESSPGRDREAEPPKKKRKQKENLTPQTSLQDVESKQDGPSSSSRPRRSPRRRGASDPEGGAGDQERGGREDLVVVLDATGKDMVTRKAVVDLTSTGLDDGPRLEATITESCTPPLTPQHRGPHRGNLAGGSLPSPPLTVPNVRRLQKSRRDEERRVEEMLDEPGDVPHEEISHAAPFIEQTVEGLDSSDSSHGDRDNANGKAAPLSRSREDSLVLMPPPDLPQQAASTSTLHRPLPDPIQRPHSTSSDRWVPSSQTQELSIPAYYGGHHDHLSNPENRAPFVGGTQVVPSSQTDEIELQMPPVSTGGPGTPREAHPPSLQIYTSPYVGNSGSSEAHSPEVIESSQQMETEMDAAWGETVAARHAAIGWSKEGDGHAPARTPSPSPRTTESQDYDAQDEFSSQEDTSQPSFDIRTSPLRVPSQMTESSASYDSQSVTITPPQVRRFRDMFKGRDEYGNELPSPSQQASDSRRSLSPISYPANGYVPDRLDDISVSPPPIPEQDSSDGSYSYGSSLSETQPTPVRNFMAMFDSQRNGEPCQVADVW
ncbi:hypothetical protein C8T65DRAFT_134921 [Cerioporus squamosus]|nr:hypothetical protein C8T65DRAFT_134921 [Cerioporus squamosus]